MFRETVRALLGGVVVYIVVVMCAENRERGSLPDSFMAAENSVVDVGAQRDDSMVTGNTNDNAIDIAGRDTESVGQSESQYLDPAEALTDSTELTDSIFYDLLFPESEAVAEETGEPSTRLKSAYYTGSDGSRVHNTTWEIAWDSKYEWYCYFHGASDGSIRCLPREATVETTPEFADASCSKRIAHYINKNISQWTECAWVQPNPKSAYLNSLVPCYGSEIFRLGDVAVLDGGKIHRKSSSGECLASPSYDDYIYYYLGDVIPPSEFVEGTLTHD
jgi:hypothetical protein